MNNIISIREYTSLDKTILLEILKLNIPEYFVESELEDLSNYLDNEIERYFVIELNHEIIGAGGINFENDYTVGKISWDFIHPKYQKLGIGRKLLQHRLDILKSMKSIETISVRTSQLTFKFYEKNGFILTEIKKDFWAKGFDMYKMIYKLEREEI
jgi:ribosomal-protein-alanine N-acetyltransferase